MTLVFILALYLQEAPNPVMIDRIALKVNDKIITERELVQKYQQYADQYEGPDREEKLKEFWNQVLDGATEQLLLYEKAVELGLDVSQEALEGRLEGLKESSGYSDDEFKQVLMQQTGMTVQEYIDHSVRDESAQRVVQSQVLSRIEVDDSEISQYYDQHQDEFMISARYRIAEIVFLKESNPSVAHLRALACQESISQGTAFDEAVRNYSDSASKDNQGDLGEVEYGDLNGDIEDEVKKLNAGDISEIIDSSTAYFIIRVLDKIDAQPRPINDVKEEIRTTLRRPRLEEKLDQFIEDLQETYLVDKIITNPPKS